MDGDSSYYRKVDGMDQSEVIDGFIVYDRVKDRVHFLNATAVIVRELCDGAWTVRDIAAYIEKAFNLSEPPVRSVRNCLSAFLSEGLIEPCDPS
jgi:hypothetical protein